MATFSQPITITAATTLSRKTHAGEIVNLSSTTGRIITLPASAGNGDVFTLFIGATVSSGNHVFQVANATDVLQGVVALTTDIAGTPIPTTTTTDTITMNGSTTGGVIGTWIRVTDAVAGFWMLEGSLVCTGVEATPFSAAV